MKVGNMLEAVLILVALFAPTATLSGQRPSPDWNGKWKLNPAKSSYQGPVLTITASGNDGFRFYVHSGVNVVCNGKRQPESNNRTLICIRVGTKALDMTLEENGLKTRVTHDELSSDGAFLVVTVTEFQPNKPATTHQIVYLRLSGLSGFPGQWRDTSYLQQPADMTLRLDDKVLHIAYRSPGVHIDAPLTGSEVTEQGQRALEGATLSIRPTRDREFLLVAKLHGKVFSQGSLQLGSDGKSLTESFWASDRPNIKDSLVYEKAPQAQ
jgi:hypothetical protein